MSDTATPEPKPRISIPRPQAFDSPDPRYTPPPLPVFHAIDLSEHAPAVALRASERPLTPAPVIEVGASRPRASLKPTPEFWSERAQQVELSARSNTGAAATALLVSASELWALAGDSARSLQLAREAQTAGSVIGHRQLRQLLAQAPNSTFETSELLTAELKLASTASLRAHTAALIATTSMHAAPAADNLDATVSGEQNPSARRVNERWQALQSVAPEDIRGYLFPLAAGTLEEVEALPPQLQEVAETLLQLRGKASLSALRNTPVEEVCRAAAAFISARRALTAGKRKEAALALLSFGEQAPFTRPAQHLAAALFEASAETRGNALVLYEALATESPLLRRRELRGLIELGETDALFDGQGNLDSRFKDTGIPLALRLALLSLFAPKGTQLGPLLASARDSLQLGAMAQVLNAHFGFPSEESVGGNEPPLAGVQLGRLLGSGATPAELADGMRQEPALDESLRNVIELEVAHQTKAYASVARRLLQFAPEADAAAAHLVAALLLEPQDPESAALHYEATLASPWFGPAAAQALRESNQDVNPSTSFGAQPSTGEKDREMWTLYRAALKAATQASSPDESPESTPRSSTQAPVSGESVSRLEQWLAAESSFAKEPFARALLATRQALAEQDTQRIGSWLQPATTLFSDQLSLLALRERLCPGDALGLAEQRERAAAQQTSSPIFQRLLLESALLFEQAGFAKDAARTAFTLLRHSQLVPYLQDAAELCLERTLDANELAPFHQHLLDRAAAAPSAKARSAFYLRLADLDARAGSTAQASLYLSQAVASDPQSLRALLEYEQLAMRSGDTCGLAAVELQLSARGFSDNAEAHLALAARFEELENGFQAASGVWQRLPRTADTAHWLTRRLLPHVKDPAQRVRLLLALKEGATNPLDVCMFSQRLAELTRSLNNPALALSYLEDALGPAPRFITAESLRAELLVELSRLPEAAEAYERVAKVANVRVHRAAAYRQAAELWRKAQDTERSIEALGRAFSAEPEDAGAFSQLLSYYQGLRSKTKLLELITSRASAVLSAADRVELQLLQSQVHAEHGETAQARQIIEQVLAEHPTESRAFKQLAALLELQANAEGMEQTLLHLARLSPDILTQADAYMRLGILYDGTLSQPDRALACYEEVRRRRPTDFAAFERLISSLLRAQQTSEARALAADQIKHCVSLEDQRILALCSARIQAQGRDFIAAEFSYREALTRWPRDPGLLTGLIQLYQAIPDRAALSELAKDLLSDVNQHLPDGAELEPATAAARLLADETGDTCAATLIQAFQRLLSAGSAHWPGALGRAMARNLDELLAPNPVSSALRTLLMQTHAVLDRAFELDLEEVEARPLDNARVQICFEAKARAVGVACPQLFIVSSSPRLCIVTNNPARVILGRDWVESAPAAALDFLAWRALKLIQARTGILERLRGQQLLATMEAFLGCFVERRPSLSDPRLVEAMRRRLTVHLPAELDDDLPVLALTVLSELENRQQSLDEAVRHWANRSALLATGDLRAALTAILFKQGETLGTGRDAMLSALRHSSEACDLVKALFDPGFLDACRITREAQSNA